MFVGSFPVARITKVSLLDPGWNVSDTITVPATGIALNEVVYNNAGTWTLAVASAVATLGTDICTNVNAPNITITAGGYVISPAHGLGTAGQALYLDQSTPGATTTTPPANGLIQMVGRVVDGDIYEVHFWAVSSE